MGIKIDNEFKSLIIRLTDSEKDLLEKSIIIEGCRDSIIIWDDYIIDGHNRHEICTKNKISYTVIEKSKSELPDRESVKQWMLKNQLGRRNLTPEKFRYFIGKLYNENKQQGKRNDLTSGNNCQKSTADAISSEYKLSEKTVRNAAEYAAALDDIGSKSGEELKDKILNREIDITQKDVVKLSEKTKAEQNKIIKLIENDEAENVHDAEIKLFSKTIPHVFNNAGDNEWYTPAEYIESALMVMGEIDLDPASTTTANKVIKSKKIYTEHDDGLSKNWNGSVWLNPPYAQPHIGLFCNKLIDEIVKGNCKQAIVLVNNATETKWFQSLAEKCAAICLHSGRVKFWHPEKISAPLQGQAILYFGDNKTTFKKSFGKYGVIVNV